ncbi:MAG TPA: radical SAM protein [Candidatus Kapabacteria bacterium]|jgi:wyosine [tRNA(Phe)-imidazoG37] synthetase (radical SAM superfamily)|nr:radical SAM protein [Candidatus Kapabacteria bacterium]
MSAPFRHIYGPVASRRLGRTLGVDPVPSKTCTYDCIYCQVGRTTEKTLERAHYVPIDEILEELGRALAEGVEADYVVIAGSGEPTLHAGLGAIIRGAHALTKLPVVVITNGSLLWRADVREDLMAADIVMPSLDAGDSQTYHYVNRPHGDLDFETIVDGIATFTREFDGEVWLEVFLLAGVTSIEAEMRKIAKLVATIAPTRTQINTATRPTAEDFAYAVSRERIEELASLIPGVVEIVGGDPVDDSRTGADEVTDDAIIGLIGRHPCTVREMATALRVHPRAVGRQLESLDREGRIKPVVRNGRIYYCAA